jgi:peptide/nickel transport system permease protein
MLLGLPLVLRGLGRGLNQVARYPSGFIGLTIILILLGSVAYTLIAIPYDDAVAQWRGTTDLSEQPRHARPAWISSLTGINHSQTIVLNTTDGSATKERETFGNVEAAILTYTFDYNYDTFPSGLALFFDSTAQNNRPHLDLTWHTPDGRDIRLTTITPSSNQIYRFDLDDRLVRRLDGLSPYQGLFADPQAEDLVPLKGTYQMVIDGIIFEEDSDLDGRLVIYGEVFGWAGTDNQRRDLSIALLWGTPTALAFGFLAAVLTTLFTMIIAGTGVWFGGWVDGLIQRITEINLAIPIFPILAMITLFYTLSIWYLLALAVLFGIFGSAIKTYRSIFLQVRESAYIEAAEAYGAGNMRIIFFYLIPRIAPVLLPQMVVLVPYYVFLEAGIAFLGLSDPLMPTWGKLINEAHTQSALLNGHYHWILQPAVLLMITALAFALVGFALDRVFNPRLQEQT